MMIPSIFRFCVSGRAVLKYMRLMMIQGACVIIISMIHITPQIAHAEQIPIETAARLQFVLNNFIYNASGKDGLFTYLNRQTAKREMLYPASKHPIIIPFDGDYFMCMTMLDSLGHKINVDFLLRPKMNKTTTLDFLVVDVFVNARHILEDAMEKL